MKHAPLFAKVLPWAVLGLAIVYVASTLIPRGAVVDGFNVQALAQLPVQDGGRIKPLDTMARTNLYAISGVQDFVDANGKRQPAIKWLLDVMISSPGRGGPGLHEKVFRIENDQVRNLLGLPERSGLRYALSEFSDHVEEFDKEADRIRSKDAEKRTLYEVKLLELQQHLNVYLKLSGLHEPRFLPPLNRRDPDWLSLRNAVEQQQAGAGAHPLFHPFVDILAAYGEGDPEKFNSSVESYRKGLERLVPETFSKAEFEVLFNRFAPFYRCMILSVVVLVLGCLSWLCFTKPLQQAAFWLALFILVVHTWALIGRIYLTGRPPVTNLYSSAIFIGWGCAGLCLFLEWVFKNGIPIVVAAVTAFISLFISHNLISGDTMEMLQAVLDTNFWLATHVVCVTMGYMATFVAGFLGVAFVLLGIHTTLFQQKNGISDMAKMIYGVVCFATLLSFTGTVLGGIWADYSWGRFWGWDPKENGALLIVIWNALVLHARWGGLVKQRGLAVLAVGGNMVTAWSWFGTNMLGVGLHSYGFMAGAKWVLIAFEFIMAAIMLIGLIPTKYWSSYQVPTVLPAPVPPAPKTKAKTGPRLKPA